MSLTLRQSVLRQLMQRGQVSGQELAQQLNVSRMAVSKAVASLRSSGFAISAQTGVGYQLVSLPDTLSADEVAVLVQHPFWRAVQGSHTVTSTNDLAGEAGRSGQPAPAVFIAAQQTAGRGRLGRTWSSPPGGLYLSVLLRPDVPVASLGSLSLVAALSVAQAVEQWVGQGGENGHTVQVKWPNDVYLDGRKLCGILLESQASTDGIDYVVVGIGINLASDAVEGAASLGLPYHPDVPGADSVHSRPARFAAQLLDRLAQNTASWVTDGFPQYADAYQQRELNVGRSVAVRNRSGQLIAEGTVVGVGHQGELILESADGVRINVSTGEVTLRS